MPQDQVENRVQMGLRAGHLDSATCELDRRREQLRPGQGPVGAMQGLEPCRRSGDRARGLADPEDLGGRSVTAELDVDRVHLGVPGALVSSPRGGHEEVREALGTAVGRVHKRKTACSRAGQRALGDP